MNQAIWRLDLAGTTQLARGDIASGPTELLPPELTIDQLLTRPDGLHKALTTETSGPVPDSATIAAPVENQRIWASGVTFERSRTARKEESTNSDVYDAVYDAERPELFFKALGTEVRGPNDRICVRPDSTWNVPEPELGLVIASTGDIVGYTIGNDVSSRSIEGENPLYLPQAKVYEGSCAIGPALIPITEAPDWNSITISLTITRDGRDIFTDSVPSAGCAARPESCETGSSAASNFRTAQSCSPAPPSSHPTRSPCFQATRAPSLSPDWATSPIPSKYSTSPTPLTQSDVSPVNSMPISELATQTARDEHHEQFCPPRFVNTGEARAMRRVGRI
ncbi:hypothetical protein GCM10020255_078220 [Rhodococcus baikonurensis]